MKPLYVRHVDVGLEELYRPEVGTAIGVDIGLDFTKIVVVHLGSVIHSAIYRTWPKNIKINMSNLTKRLKNQVEKVIKKLPAETQAVGICWSTPIADGIPTLKRHWSKLGKLDMTASEKLRQQLCQYCYSRQLFYYCDGDMLHLVFC